LELQDLAAQIGIENYQAFERLKTEVSGFDKSVENIRGQLRPIDQRMRLLSRFVLDMPTKITAMQQYSPWVASPDGRFFSCQYISYPVDSEVGPTAHYCIFFVEDHEHIYFYSAACCTYWGRYNIGSPGTEFSWLPESERAPLPWGVRPTGKFSDPGSMPHVPHSAVEQDTMREPNINALAAVIRRTLARKPTSSQEAPAGGLPAPPAPSASRLASPSYK
jgi:hypothetical protein